MKTETWIGKKGARYWYYKYRDSEYLSVAMIVGTVIACLFLIFTVIIPQVTNWFSIRDEIVATRAKITVLQDNINFMNNLDKGMLNSQLSTATNALPPEKDFGSMLDVLSEASVTSGVSLNDFSFQVGNVASSSGAITDTQRKGLASIKITVVAVGTVDRVRRFIQTLEKTVPVSELVNIDGSGQTISLSIQFYQKSLPDLQIQPDQPLSPLSAEKVNLLQQLATWKKSQPFQMVDETNASASAVPLF